MSALAGLEQLPIFKDLGEEPLRVLRGVVTQRTYRDTDTLFHEGERAREMFVVLAGKVSIYKKLPNGREECLATLGPGALLGELSVIDGLPRSASARASGGNATLLVLGREDFDHLFRANKPFAFILLDRIVIELAGRLRRATGRLAEASALDSPAARATTARQAALSLHGINTGTLDLIDIDLDAVTVDTAPPEQRLLHRKKPF